MKKALLLLTASACLLAGCAGQAESGSLSQPQSESAPQSAQAESAQTEAQTSQSAESTADDNPAAITASGANCSVTLSYNTSEEGAAALDAAIGETRFSRSFYGDFAQDGAPKVELVQLDGWNIVAIRVPYNGFDGVQFYYLTEDTLQSLYSLSLFELPPENKITADLENNCFCFTDRYGEERRFKVVYDEYGGSYPFRLRNADYVERTVIQSQNTALGEVRFSYKTYADADGGIVISNVNFVELYRKDPQGYGSCDIRSPVYQGAGSYDNLAAVCAPLKLEVLDYTDWGIAAVRVPYPEGAYDVPTESLSLVYFDGSKIMLLENGFFIPGIAADSEITADAENGSFTLTLKDGTKTQYIVSPETGCIAEKIEPKAE